MHSLRSTAVAVSQYGAIILDFMHWIGGKYLVHVVLSLTLPHGAGPLRVFTVYLQFDNCSTNCLATSDRILGFLGAAVDDLKNCNCGIIGYTFTNSRADWSQINSIMDTAQQKWGGVNIAIFFVATEHDSSGHAIVHFRCIGQMCANLTPEQRREEACLQAGQGPNCDAREEQKFQRTVPLIPESETPSTISPSHFKDFDCSPTLC